MSRNKLNYSYFWILKLKSVSCAQGMDIVNLVDDANKKTDQVTVSRNEI